MVMTRWFHDEPVCLLSRRGPSQAALCPTMATVNLCSTLKSPWRIHTPKQDPDPVQPSVGRPRLLLIIAAFTHRRRARSPRHLKSEGLTGGRVRPMRAMLIIGYHRRHRTRRRRPLWTSRRS